MQLNIPTKSQGDLVTHSEFNSIVAAVNSKSEVTRVANYAALPVTGSSNTTYITEDDGAQFYWDGTAYQPTGGTGSGGGGGTVKATLISGQISNAGKTVTVLGLTYTVVGLYLNDMFKSTGFSQLSNAITFTDPTEVVAGDVLIFLR